MLNISKICKLILCVCMVFVLFPIVNVSAIDEEEIISTELENAIISGDGSAENPYKVDYSKAPHFKNYMDRIEETVMMSLQGKTNSDNNLRGIFDGILIGKKHTSQNKGGTWRYVSGAPNVNSNGNIWMRSISYSTVADTKENYKTKSNEYYWNRISAIAEDIATKPYSQAYDLIVSSGISGTAATALLRALGKANAVFGYVSILTFIKDYFSLSKYRSAANNGYGMLHAIYQTSYQGKWYSHDAEDSWTTANTVYEPASFYGTGVYEANTK